MKTVDATGTVVSGYTYDVYGKKTSSTGSQANEFDFAGQQTDATGLQYLRARYYDPGTGTFTNREPVDILPSWRGHPFSYGRSRPTGLVDPSGLFPTEPEDGGSAARGMFYGCSPGGVGCGYDYSWNYGGGLDGSGDRWTWIGVAKQEDGTDLIGICSLSSEYGRECSPVSVPSFAEDTLIGAVRQCLRGGAQAGVFGFVRGGPQKALIGAVSNCIAQGIGSVIVDVTK